jgi:hypothetical protein
MRRKPLFPPPHDPETGKRLANKGRQHKSILTVNGRIQVFRRWWHSPRTGSLAPVDELANHRGATVTPGVCEMVCRENRSSTSFADAAKNLARTAQLELSDEQLRSLVLAEGRSVLAEQQAATLATAWTAADCTLPPESPDSAAKTRVYTGCDGVMVPTITQAEKDKRRAKVKEKRRKRGRKCKPLPPPKKGADQSWKEFKVVYFYDETLTHQHVAVTHRNHEAAGKLLRREAERLKFAAADERVALVDGAPWIREELMFHLPELDGLGLDFYHLSTNVHRAKRTVFGEESVEGQKWAEELLHHFKHEGYEPTWNRLVQWRATVARSPQKRRAADRLLNFVSDRRTMIDYPRFRDHGWQIGSGPTESQCGLTTGRLKGHSRRWDRPNAEAVAALDALARSDQWHSHFPNSTPTPN